MKERLIMIMIIICVHLHMHTGDRKKENNDDEQDVQSTGPAMEQHQQTIIIQVVWQWRRYEHCEDRHDRHKLTQQLTTKR